MMLRLIHPEGEEKDMKHALVWALILVLMLTACGKTVPTETTAATEPIPAPVTEPVTEPSTEPPTEPPTEPEPTVPVLAQQDYPVPYGAGYLPTGGCGITSVAMVLSYFTGEPVSPADLAQVYGRFYTSVGSDWALFPTVAEDYGLTCTQCFNEKEVLEALADNKLVICNQYHSAFTSDGHFIVLAGLTPDGKIIVHDPNRKNWEKDSLKDGFENGFEPRTVTCGSIGYWIYE